MVTPRMIPDQPMRNRHTLEIAANPSHVDHQGNVMLMEKDIQDALNWLADHAGVGLSSSQWIRRAESLRWTSGYRRAMTTLVRDHMIEATKETAQQALARIVCGAEEIREAGMARGELVPALGALKLQADILLAPKSQQHVHLHAALQSGDLSEVPEEELLKAIAADSVTDG